MGKVCQEGSRRSRPTPGAERGRHERRVRARRRRREGRGSSGEDEPSARRRPDVGRGCGGRQVALLVPVGGRPAVQLSRQTALLLVATSADLPGTRSRRAATSWIGRPGRKGTGRFDALTERSCGRWVRTEVMMPPAGGRGKASVAPKATGGSIGASRPSRPWRAPVRRRARGAPAGGSTGRRRSPPASSRRRWPRSPCGAR